MNIFMEKAATLCLLVVISLFLTASAAPAQNYLSGRMSLERDYNSNIFRDPDNEIAEWTSTVAPELTYARRTQNSNLSVSYSPDFVYNSRTDDFRVGHYANAGYSAQLTRRLETRFNNTFIRTEDPYQQEEIEGEDIGDPIEILDRRGKRKYWINSFSATAGYTYGQERLLKVGYRNRVLENREGLYSHYIRHSPFASVSHRFNHQWDIGLEYSFVRGEFDDPESIDESEDLLRNTGDFYLYYRFSPLTRVFGHLGYEQTNYDDGLDDYEVYTAATGLNHQYSRTLNLELEVGSSLVKRHNFSDSEAVYLRSRIEKSWQRSSWYIDAESGLDAREFGGVDNLGLSRYRVVGTGVERTLLRNLEGSADFYYREDDYLNREPRVDEQRLEASAGLTWSFARWYEIACSYTFVDQDSDIVSDIYEDHRFFIGVSAERDLFRWE